MVGVQHEERLIIFGALALWMLDPLLNYLRLSSLVSRKKKAEGKQVVNGVLTEESKAYNHKVEHREEKPKGAHLFPYGEGPWDSALCILDDLPQVFDALADQVVKISEESIKLRGNFTIVLSGGSLVKVRWGCLMTFVNSNCWILVYSHCQGWWRVLAGGTASHEDKMLYETSERTSRILSDHTLTCYSVCQHAPECLYG